MSRWVSPVPSGIHGYVRVFRPDVVVRSAADLICDRAWRGLGVRVFHWPCGTLAVVSIGQECERVMMVRCLDHLLGTYARHPATGIGPMLVDVLHDIHWARVRAA